MVVQLLRVANPELIVDRRAIIAKARTSILSVKMLYLKLIDHHLCGQLEDETFVFPMFPPWKNIQTMRSKE